MVKNGYTIDEIGEIKIVRGAEEWYLNVAQAEGHIEFHNAVVERTDRQRVEKVLSNLNNVMTDEDIDEIEAQLYRMLQNDN